MRRDHLYPSGGLWVTKLRSPLHWAGGKGNLVDQIQQHFPPKISTYVEPFVGGGSVFLNTEATNYVINDFNPDIASFWSCLRDHTGFTENCRKLYSPENDSVDAYYALREEFNSLPRGDVRRAEIFVYLNKHCYNGLCRYNAKGGFNSPRGRHKTKLNSGVTFAEAEMCAAKYKLVNNDVIISGVDFRQVFDGLAEGDVVYCDPPYVPLTQTANFTSYTPGGFWSGDQMELARLACEARARGATAIISNHWTDWTENLYRGLGAQLFPVEGRRRISCKTRKPVKEVLAVWK